MLDETKKHLEDQKLTQSNEVRRKAKRQKQMQTRKENSCRQKRNENNETTFREEKIKIKINK